MTNVKTPSMLLRIFWLVNIVLGIGLWTGKFDVVKEIHMTVGILLVLALWWITFLHVRRNGWDLLAIGAVLDGVALYVVGITQENILVTGPHWVIQVVHLTLALVTIALGEIMTLRVTRVARPSAA